MATFQTYIVPVGFIPISKAQLAEAIDVVLSDDGPFWTAPEREDYDDVAARAQLTDMLFAALQKEQPA